MYSTARTCMSEPYFYDGSAASICNLEVTNVVLMIVQIFTSIVVRLCKSRNFIVGRNALPGEQPMSTHRRLFLHPFHSRHPQHIDLGHCVLPGLRTGRTPGDHFAFVCKRQL